MERKGFNLPNFGKSIGLFKSCSLDSFVFSINSPIFILPNSPRFPCISRVPCKTSNANIRAKYLALTLFPASRLGVKCLDPIFIGILYRNFPFRQPQPIQALHGVQLLYVRHCSACSTLHSQFSQGKQLAHTIIASSPVCLDMPCMNCRPTKQGTK